MFAEDRFGRRLRKEREDRGMTQADVARVLDMEHDLKLHATAIAKMEQRDADRPRAIRLSEARAIADMFGLTIDEMASAGESEVQAVARELLTLTAQAETLTAQTEEVMGRLHSISSIMGAPAEQLTPELLAARGQIMQSLDKIDWGLRRRASEGFAFMQEWGRYKSQEGSVVDGVMEPDDLRKLRTQGLSAVWIRALHELYPGVSKRDLAEDGRMDNGDSAYRLAALVNAPDGVVATWLMCSVVARGLWGHGVAVELDQRISQLLPEHKEKGIPYVKRTALGAMAGEIERELEGKWPTIMEHFDALEEVWHDPEALRIFITEAEKEA